MKKLSFIEYLDSKKQLLQAIKESPIQTINYEITSYCKLIVGEKEDKQAVSLKPKQTVIVEWEYDDVNADPTPISIRFDDVKDIDALEEFVTYWSGTKLKSWLHKNAAEQY